MSDKIEFSEEQQAKVNELVGLARTSARDKAQADFQAQAETSAAEAEKASLAANKQWETLAANAEARVTALAPLEEQVEAYRGVIEGMLKDRVKALGSGAKQAIEALPETMDALAKLAWLNKNTELFGQVGGSVGTPRRGKSSSNAAQVNKTKGYRRIGL